MPLQWSNQFWQSFEERAGKPESGDRSVGIGAYRATATTPHKVPPPARPEHNDVLSRIGGGPFTLTGYIHPTRSVVVFYAQPTKAVISGRTPRSDHKLA